MENETDEQFEERVLNKRAAQMFVSVRARMQKVDSIYLSEMTVKNNRKQVRHWVLSTQSSGLTTDFLNFPGCTEILLTSCAEKIPSS